MAATCNAISFATPSSSQSKKTIEATLFQG
jgi:hypothetical protein